MNTLTIMLIVVVSIAFVVLVGTLSKLPKLRYAFIVPEGYAGLLYQHGKFVELLGPGRHVRWGRNFTIGAQDTRKTFLTVASQVTIAGELDCSPALQSSIPLADQLRQRFAEPQRLVRFQHGIPAFRA